MSLPRIPTSSARLRRAVPVAAIIVGLSTLTACAPNADTTDFSGNDAVVEGVVKKLADRAANDDTSGICRRLLSDGLRAKFAKVGDGDCSKGVAAALDHADYTQLKVLKVTPQGDPAAKQPAVVVATIDTIEDVGTREIVLTRSGNTYVIDAFRPVPAKVAATTPASTTPASTTP